jgi:hypothetical protein
MTPFFDEHVGGSLHRRSYDDHDRPGLFRDSTFSAESGSEDFTNEILGTLLVDLSAHELVSDEADGRDGHIWATKRYSGT